MSLPKLFISYKSGHQASDGVIQEIENELGQDFDLLRDADMEVSKRWTRELYDWLLGCDAAIVILSKEANASDWCRREWAVLVARWNIMDIPVIPVCVESEFFDTGILDEIQGTKGVITADNYLEKIKTALSGVSSQERTANDYLAAHQAWLYWQYHDAPIFQKEPYALADVYIEPECGSLLWEQVQNDKKDPFQEKGKCGGRELMLETVLSLMGNPDFSDLITIQAGPGAGKSAFTYRLASKLIDGGLQSIIIKFKDLRLSSFSTVDELLDDAIRIGFADEDSPNPGSEIINTLLEERIKFQQAEICKTVIILDGWDEVSLTGNVSFKAQLSTWLPKIRDYFIKRRGVKVRLVLTGRPSNEVSHSGVLRKTTPLLTMRAMRPEQLQQYAKNISRYLIDAQNNPSKEIKEAAWSLNLQTLKPVFEHYESWFNEEHQQGSDSTGDFLGNPLLAYLSFRVFSETDKSPEDLISKPTALYHELINITVKYAGKGQDEDLEEAAHRGGENLRRLLQEVAATISILRGESVSFTELEARFEDRELPIPKDLLNNWHHQADTETALQELVINFYFKGGNTNLGCEFLHKSFREYLFAEAIFSALLDVSKARQGLFEPYKNYDYWEDFDSGTPEYDLSRRLAYLLSPQWLTGEVRTHLFWLIENHMASHLNQWQWLRDAVLSVYAWWAEGALLRHQPTRSRVGSRWEAPYIDTLFQQVIPFDTNDDLAPIRTSVLDSHFGHALMQITAYIFDQLSKQLSTENNLKKRELTYCSALDDSLRFQPGGEGFFKALISKFTTEGWGQRDIKGMFLGRIKLLENEFSGFISGFSCVLREADLYKVNLVQGNFSYSNLVNANLSSAILMGAFFIGANLYGANLSRADLKRTDFRHTKLRNTDLSEADLSGADLSGADLSGANLSGANLSGANLSRAKLSGGNLNGTNLSGVDLSDVDLSEVIGYSPKS
ncbi:pentapeptide repeat-containing protein [Thalassomonas actiniarum]|uniref:Pentapeptide repeat-containing protein n=1 Tax=Thalassomonas actiniarum TaxID=485447 RepID=A0AAE9YX41_9GAMM|nr:pentapeptide repeat-containing protein [Thalassomonas actiniarum]WDE02493.1 pentapeptide repeat-containing protein [Thalassomonas actiniarum]